MKKCKCIKVVVLAIAICLSFGLQTSPTYAQDDTNSTSNQISIVPAFVVVNFDIDVDGVEVAEGTWYDLPSTISGRFMADNVEYFVEYYDIIFTNTTTSESWTENYTTADFSVDISGFADGVYTVTIQASGIRNISGIEIPQTWTMSFGIELKSTSVDVSINGEHGIYNPSSIDTGYHGDNNNWVIKNENGIEVTSGNGDVISQEIIDSLDEGTYTVENTSTATTINGTDVDPSTAIGTFIIRHPESTTIVDRETNPGSITGTKKIEDSTLDWVIKDEDGNIIVVGTGDTIPQNTIDGLENGSYTVEFTETSPEGETYVSSGNFIIDKSEETETPEDATGNPDVGESKNNGTDQTSVTDKTAPSTGDNQQILAFLGLIIISSSLVPYAIKHRKKETN